jgi:ribosomal protein S18 acetylase RimI-like enzyme
VIRPIQAADSHAILALATETAVFKPHEIVALDEVLSDYFATNKALGHQAARFDHGDQILGFAYWAPAAMTDRTWYLYWIAVAPAAQGGGIGSDLLAHVEGDVCRRGGRLLLIETSSLPRYELTRTFYIKHLYEQVCAIGDFYADGDDMVVFRKRLI